MKTLTLRPFIFSIFIFCLASFGQAQTRYWVGGTGSWNQTSHWSTTPGGTPGASLPTLANDVEIDNNSFPSGGTITVTPGAACFNLKFSPFITGVTLDIANDLTLGGFDVNFDSPLSITVAAGAKFDFSTTNAPNITVSTGGPGKTMPGITVNNLFAHNLYLNGTSTNTDTYGKIAMGDNASFNVNGASGKNVNIGGLTIGNTNTVNLGTGVTVIFTEDVTCGTLSKLTSAENVTYQKKFTVVSTNQSSNDGLIYSKDVTFNGDVSIKGEKSFLTIKGNSIANGIFRMDDKSPNAVFGTIGQSTQFATFNNDVFFGFSTVLDINPNITFNCNSEFRDPLNIGKFCRVTFGNTSSTGAFFRTGTATMNMDEGSFAYFRTDVTFQVAGTKLNIGKQATVLVSVPAPEPPAALNATFRDVIFQPEARMFFNNNFGNSKFDNITLSQFNYIEFNGVNPTDISGTFIASDGSACSNWNYVKGAFNGGQKAKLNFSQLHTGGVNKPIWRNVIMQDLDIDGPGTPTLIVQNGVNIYNSVVGKVQFTVSPTSNTFYWVGGTVGNTKSGVDDNANWTNPKNWATASGDVSGTNTCTPNSQDDVVFDDKSFNILAPAAKMDVTINTPVVACNNMTWTGGVPAGASFDALAVNDNNNSNVIVYGNFLFAPNLNNQYEGTFIFGGDKSKNKPVANVPYTVDAQGVPFLGGIDFDHQNGEWNIVINPDPTKSSLNVDGGSRGDIRFVSGKANGNGAIISLEDDWVVYNGDNGNLPYNGVYSSGTGGKVIFDGPLSTDESQLLRPGPSSHFYDLQIARTGGSGGITNAQSVKVFAVSELFVQPPPNGPKDIFFIDNNLDITSGALWDEGYQIYGNATGTFSMANQAHLLLGSDVNPDPIFQAKQITTRFPDFFGSNKINFNANSTVWYIAGGNQNIRRLSSTNPSRNYGNLNVGNNPSKFLATTPATDDAANQLTLQGSLAIGGLTDLQNVVGVAYNDPTILFDQGFQIVPLAPATANFSLGQGSGFFIGQGTSASTFPAYTTPNVNIGTNTTVCYFADADQIVRGLDDPAFPERRYWNLTLRNQGTTNIRKTLDRIAGIRGTLKVENKIAFADDGYQLKAYPPSSKLDLSDFLTPTVSTAELILGGTNQAIQNPGSTYTERVGNTTIPGFNNFNIAPGNTITYASNRTDQDQNVFALPTGEDYYNLVITNWKPLSSPGSYKDALGAFVTTRKTLLAPSITVRNSLLIDGTIATENPALTTTFWDGGNQITGGGAASLQINPNGIFQIGKGATATTFPSGFSSISLNALSTVSYFADAPQPIADFPVYGNLTLDGASGIAKPKTLTGGQTSLNLNGDIRIRGFNNLIDNGKQITGRNPSPDSLFISANGLLTLGTGTVTTQFPLNYIRNNSNLFLDGNSEVIYNAGEVPTAVTPQLVAGNFTYGKLTLTNPTASTGSPLADKRLIGDVTVTDLTVNNSNRFDTQNFQITGTAGRKMRVGSETQILLGNAATATLFPLNYNQSDIFLDATNGTGEIVYNSGQPQIIRGLPGTNTDNFTYVNLTLTSPGGTAVTKVLNNNTNIRRNLTINNFNTLDVTASDYNISIQGNWVGNPGSSFNPQGGTVIFNSPNGTVGNVVQSILTNNNPATNNHAFGRLTVDLTPGADVQLQDNVTVKNVMNFADGYLRGDFPVAGNDPVNSSNNLLIFPDENATVNNADNNSHVKFSGVRRTGGTDFTYPVGNGTLYRYIRTSNSSDANPFATFTGRYLNRNPASDGYPQSSKQTAPLNLSQPPVFISLVEYWTLDRSAGTNSDVDVTLSWNTNSGGVINPAKMQVVRWNGGEWRDHGFKSITGTISTGEVTSNLDVSGNVGQVNAFSPFTLSSEVNPLPVTLLSFKAEAIEKQVKVNWQTTAEYKILSFTIERSRDGQNWETLTNIDAKGSPNAITDYAILDKNPWAGTSYYRLRTTDLDGTVSFSKRVSVFITGEKPMAVLYPNPAAGSQVFVQTALKVEAVYDVLGKAMAFKAQPVAEEAGTWQVQFAAPLSPGSYIMLLSGADGVSLRVPFVVRP
jgi:hypothetical protein